MGHGCDCNHCDSGCGVKLTDDDKKKVAPGAADVEPEVGEDEVEIADEDLDLDLDDDADEE